MGDKFNHVSHINAWRIIDHISDVFLLVDDHGRIVQANDALESTLGWKVSEVIGAEIEILLAPQMRDEHKTKRALFYHSPKNRNMNELLNLTALHKDGFLVPIDIKLSHTEIEGEIYGIAIVRDVSKQRDLQAALEEKYQIIKRTLAEKNHLLGIAAHDMRNPIGVIQNFAEILLSHGIGSLNADQDEFVSRIHQSAKFTMALLEDMLDFSTIESGTLQLHKETFRFLDLLDEIIPANKICAHEKNISLIVNTGAVDTVKLNADKRKCHQVIHNLINNAIKYSPHDSHININTGIVGKKLVFSVEDQGVGIPKEDLVNLFKPFYRAKNKPTAGEKSTGLGLFISKRIVEAHDGHIYVNSVNGNGSIFSVEFPLAAIKTRLEPVNEFDTKGPH